MQADNDLGQAIALLRGARSQVEVSRKGRISSTTWNLYEKGHRKPTKANFQKILNGLGCSRLQFEEVRWRLIHQRLLREETAQELGNYTARTRTATLATQETQEGKEEEVRREFRRLLARMAPLIEELIILTTIKRM